MQINEQMLQTFAQDDYYLRSWAGIHSGESRFGIINPYALIFGMAWCFYRKLYVLGAISLIAGLVASYVGALAYAAFTNYAPAPQSTYTFVGLLSLFILVRLPLAIIADKFYYNMAVEVIERHYANTEMTAGDRDFHISDEGGTSVVGVIVALLLSQAVNYLL